jgi:hypothetical protein
MAVPINDPSITWAKYDVRPYPPFPDVTYARAAVRTERRLELALEGQRFFDLRRYGMTVAEQAINNDYLPKEQVRRAYLTAAEPIAAKHRWFAIPPLQIDLSKVGGQETLKQNPGW